MPPPRRRLPPTLLAGTVAAAWIFAGAGPARAAASLSPFRPPGDGGARLSPIRRAQAEPAPAPNPAAAPNPEPATDVPAAGAPPPPDSEPAPRAASPAACAQDAQCPAGTICEDGACRPYERPLHVLLFRKEGGSTMFIPLYFSHPGNPGHRVVAPLYWHFWGPEARSRIVFPFYWRFEDHLKQRVVTVIPPVSWTRQPDATSWAVWPFIYSSSKFGWAAPLLASFKIADPDRGRAFGLYALLYFWKRTPASAFDLGFPLFVSRRSQAGAFTFALPLNFYWRSADRKRLLAIPFFYRGWDDRDDTFASLLGYRSRAGDNTRGSLFWLYWWGRSKASRYDVVFPLVWSFRGPERETTLALPVYLGLRRGAWSFRTAALLYWGGRDDNKGSSFNLLLPIFYAGKSHHGQRSLWLTPLGGGRRDDEAKTRAFTWLLPPIVHRKSPERRFDAVIPLFFRHHDYRDGSKTMLAGLYYRGTDPDGATNVVFPFIWHFRDARNDATALAALPFYFQRRAPDDRTTAAGIFPLMGYHRRFRDGYAAGLFPLASWGRRGDRRHAYLAPLFFHFEDRRSAFSFVPFLYLHRRDPRGSFTNVALAYFQGEDQRRRYHIAFPLVWHHVDKATNTSTWVVPPVYHRSSPRGSTTALVPLVFAGRDGPRRHLVVFPLYWRFRDDDADRTTTVFANYLHRTHGGETTDALFPLFHYRRGAKPGGGDEASLTLFPLLHFRRTDKLRLFASPVAVAYATPERRAGFVLLYFWYRGRDLEAATVPPFFLDLTNHRTRERTRILGPYIAVDSPRGSTRAVFPLFARYRQPGETGTWVLPTFFRRRTDAGYQVDTLFPLFWWSRSPVHRTVQLGPYFRRTAPDGDAHGLIPAFVHLDNAKRNLWITPLFVHRRDKESGDRRTFAWLYYGSRTADAATDVAFPVWWSGRRGPRSHRVLFPIFWRFEDRKEDSVLTIAGPLVYRRSKTEVTRGLAPFGWFTRDPANRSASTAIVPLFYEHHSPTRFTLMTLPFGFGRAPGTRWWYAGLAYHRETATGATNVLFPLWFGRTERAGGVTRFVPPLLHVARQTPTRGFSATMLLFWRSRSITSTTTLALPLYYDIHDHALSRTTLFVPLFLRHRNELAGTTTWFAPLLYRRNGPADSTTVLFPLLWDFRSAERSTTVVFPLWVGIRRPTFSANYVFPNVYWRTGRGPDAGTSRLFVFPFWESAVRRPGDTMWEVLLGVLGYERIGRNRTMKVLFIPFDLDPAPAAQVAWYGHRPTRPVIRARGLEARAW